MEEQKTSYARASGSVGASEKLQLFGSLSESDSEYLTDLTLFSINRLEKVVCVLTFRLSFFSSKLMGAHITS